MNPFIEPSGDGWRVGARDPDSDYLGPVADVYAEEGWIIIETDPHEGSAMLNIEALPQLIEALSAIADKLASGWRP